MLATLMRMLLNAWSQILFSGDLHDAALKNFCTTECQLYGWRLHHVIFIFTRRVEIRQRYDLLRNIETDNLTKYRTKNNPNINIVEI